MADTESIYVLRVLYIHTVMPTLRISSDKVVATVVLESIIPGTAVLTY